MFVKILRKDKSTNMSTRSHYYLHSIYNYVYIRYIYIILMYSLIITEVNERNK